jgi:DNA-binding NarL/FixJ family response regulator
LAAVRRILARRQPCWAGCDGRGNTEGDGQGVMGNRRIVIVEDDVFIRLDLSTHLREAGHNVVGTAASAAEAVRVAERERPDLVLMDVRLVGERDGIDAATEIWRRFSIRSLLVSANLDAAARVKAAAANPVGFLEKPYTPTKLIAAVSAVGRA